MTNRESWNGWTLRGEQLVHVFDGYVIDLSTCTSSAQVLDLIMEAEGWADDDCLAGLLHALADILDPQASLCAGGEDKRLTTAALRELLARGL